MLSDAAARGPRTPSAICARLAASTQRPPRPALVCSRSRSASVAYSYGEHSVGESAGVQGAGERFACPSFATPTSTRGAERTGAMGVRAQIAAGVRGPRAAASESTPRAVRAAPCLSLHVTCLAGGLLSAVAVHGHAARRRLCVRYNQRRGAFALDPGTLYH